MSVLAGYTATLVAFSGNLKKGKKLKGSDLYVSEEEARSREAQRQKSVKATKKLLADARAKEESAPRRMGRGYTSGRTIAEVMAEKREAG